MKKQYAYLLIGAVLLTGSCKPAAKEEEKVEKAPQPVTTVAAKREDVAITVAAQGTFSPVQGGVVKLAAPYSARLLRVLVREGDSVKVGQVVAVLDTSTLFAQETSAAAAYQAAISQANGAKLTARAAASDNAAATELARAALKVAISSREANIAAARTALGLAVTNQARTEAGARPQEIVQANDALRQAQATLARARTEQTRQAFLFEKGVAARRQVEDAQTALDVAEAAAENAAQALELTKAGARREDRDTARLRVAQARQALDAAIAGGDAQVAQARAALRQAEAGQLSVTAKTQDIRTAESNAQKAAADQTAARTQAGYGEIRSPIAGIVTKRSNDPGDMADTTTPLLEITDLSGLDLLAKLPAEEATKITPGMMAQVIPDGTNSTYTGKVQSVGQVDTQSGLASVRIRVQNVGSKLRAGVFARAEIVVRTDKNAIVVPKEAVLTRDGETQVFTVEKDAAHKNTVKLGAEIGDIVEVVSGLAADATVIRIGQYNIADGDPVREVKP